jgi:threonylcarbamoyladenosine tRNA methylthiotransferase MtaB
VPSVRTPRPRVALVSLGCRVSAAEVDALAGHLAPRFDLVAEVEAAEVVVVNTCAVTGDADATARQAIRRAARRNPGARIVAAGCYAQLSPEDLTPLPGVAAVVGARSRDAVAEVAAAVARLASLARRTSAARPAIPDGPGGPAGQVGPASPASPARARPLLKVQDGCDSRCAYCAVPAARGPSRSLPFEAAVASLVELGAGHAEVVLTGVHLGHYGRDLAPPRSLEALVAAAVAGGLRARLRLSSVEPLEVPLGLLRDPATAAALCPHLHLPLQSGSARVLQAMGRPYGPEEVRRVVEAVAALQPGCCLGADVMAGFPGETDRDHHATVALCQALPLAYLHVFPFSPRPGTPAAARPDQVAPPVVRARARELRELSARRWQAYLSAQVGRELEVVVERVEGGWARGTAANHVGVRWAAGPEPRGARCRVLVTHVDGRGCSGARATSAFGLGAG